MLGLLSSSLKSQEIDTTFIPNILSASPGYAIDRQPDGKLIVGVSKDVIVENKRQRYVVRFLPDGGLDSTFAYPKGILGRPVKIKCQKDGKIVMIGSFKDDQANFIGNVLRLLPDGQIDSSFNLFSSVPFNLRDIEVLPNDKILVLGSGIDELGNNYFIDVLHPDGVKDTGFSTMLFDISDHEFNLTRVRDIGFQSDNEIILAGTDIILGEFEQHMFRVDSTGSIDTSFNPKVVFDTTYRFAVKQLAILEDGRMGVLSDDESCITLLDREGEVVSTFMFENKNRSTLPLNSLFPLNKEDYIVWGKKIHVLSASGDFSQALQLTGFDDRIEGSVITSDTTVVITGSFTYLNTIFGGSLSPGITQFKFKRNEGWDYSLEFRGSFKAGIFDTGTIRDFAIQPDGKIVIGGYFHLVDGYFRNHFTRLLPNGRLDTAFNPAPVSIEARIEEVKMLPNGNLVVAGKDNSPFFISFSKNLTLTDQNGYHLLNLDFPYLDSFRSIPSLDVSTNGNIFAGTHSPLQDGFTSYQPLVRYTPEGEMDEKYHEKYFNSLNNFQGFQVLDDDKLLLWGYQIGYDQYDTTYIVKINPSGKRDTSFNPPLNTSFIAKHAFELDSGIVGVIGNEDIHSKRIIKLLDSTGRVIHSSTLKIQTENSGFIFLWGVKPVTGETINISGNFNTYDGRKLAHNSVIIDKYGNFVSELFPNAEAKGLSDIEYIAPNHLMMSGRFVLETIASPLLKLMVPSIPTSKKWVFPSEGSINLYPNPVSTSTINLEVERSLMNKHLTLEIFELASGRLLVQRKIRSQQINAIEVGDLQDGTYILKLYDGEYNFIKLFVRQ